MTAIVAGRGRVPTAPFRPQSPCDAACVDASPADCGWPMRVLRYATLVGVVAVTAAIAAFVRLMPAGQRRTRAASTVLRNAARAILAILGVDIDPGVRLPRERALVVANHISWLDIVALLASGSGQRLRLVAKVEVAGWPVIGRLATVLGTVFIDRNRPRTLPATVAEVRRALIDGDVVVVFAEGTTCCGVHRAPFRPAVFQAAVDAQARVFPVTIRYADGHGVTSTVPAFLGDETLITSLRRVVARRQTRVGLRVGAPLYPQAGAGRRRLAMAAQHAGAREVRRTPVVPTQPTATPTTVPAPTPTATPTLTTASA